MDSDQIALQLYTVRAHTQANMLGTLREVAAIGYRGVELAGYGNASVREIRATLDELGVRAVSAHTPLERFLAHPEQMLEELRALGCAYAVVPAVGAERRGSVAAARAVAGALNELGARCREAGLGFAYHNHAFEFAPLGETTLWEVLLAETDPALVQLELDVAWAAIAGHDPAELLRGLGGRVALLHAKDRQAGAQFVDMPIGDGVLDWPAILAAARAAGVRSYIVEQDNPRNPLGDARRSFEALRGMAVEHQQP